MNLTLAREEAFRQEPPQSYLPLLYGAPLCCAVLDIEQGSRVQSDEDPRLRRPSHIPAARESWEALGTGGISGSLGSWWEEPGAQWAWERAPCG